MNSSDTIFVVYTIALIVSGILMVVAAVLPGKTALGRAFGVLIGLGLLGYGLYLGLIFQGGSYWMFFYVFVVPFLYIVRAVKAFADRRDRRDAERAARLAADQQPPAEES